MKTDTPSVSASKADGYVYQYIDIPTKHDAHKFLESVIFLTFLNIIRFTQKVL